MRPSVLPAARAAAVTFGLAGLAAVVLAASPSPAPAKPPVAPAPAVPAKPPTTPAPANLESLWRGGRYAAAEAAAATAPSAPLAKLVLAKANFFAGRYLTSQQLASTAADGLTGDAKREAQDTAARAAFLRGDNRNASRLAALACAGASGWPQSWESADLFCKRFPSGFLNQLGGLRFPRELSAKHAVSFTSNRPTVPATFGTLASTAFVDTGSEASVIEARDAASLGALVTEYTTRVTGFTDAPLTVHLGVVPKLQLAGWELRQVPVIVLPNVFPPGALPSPFILGINELAPFAATFDWPARTFTLSTHGKPLDAQNGLLLADRASGLSGPNLRARLTSGAANLWVTPDTGSNRLLLSKLAVDREGLQLGDVGGGSGVAGVNGTLQVQSGVFPADLTLLGKTFSFVPFGLAPSLPEGADGVAGTDLIFQGRLVVDLQGQGVYLK